MKKEGQRQGRRLTLTIWEAFTLKPDKKGYMRQTVKVLEVTTDESKPSLAILCKSNLPV